MNVVFLKIINQSIAAGWLILAVILLRLILKKAPKWISCVLWALVAVRLVCLPSLESTLSLVPSSETIPGNIEMMDRPAIDTGFAVINEAVNPIIFNNFTPDAQEGTKSLQIIISALSVIWIIGMAAMLLNALISLTKLKESVEASIPVKDNIYACDEVKSPFILGMIKPKIYVPSSMNGTTLDYVITHETAHIKRRDHWWKPFGFLLLTIYWFDPLCWIAFIMLCRDIEMACDEKVIREMGINEKAAYSQAILDCSFPRKRVAACPLAFGEVGIKERIQSVLNYKKPTFSVILMAVLICSVAGVCFMTDPKGESNTEPLYEIDKPYSYEITIDSPEWSNLSLLERKNAYTIPQNVYTKMTTDALLESLLANPKLSGIYAFGSLASGIEEMEKSIPAFAEFMQRTDAADTLKCYIENFDVSSLPPGSRELASYQIADSLLAFVQ